jgi:hypothetical protein
MTLEISQALREELENRPDFCCDQVEEIATDKSVSVVLWFEKKVFTNISSISRVLDRYGVSGWLARNKNGYVYLFIN